MNRLQKKCLIAVVGSHLLVLVILFCSGFIRPKPNQNDTPTLDMVPPGPVESTLNSGARNARLPEPTPTPTPPVAQPTPPVAQPVTPPQPKVVEPVRPVEPEHKEVERQNDPEPAPKPPKPHEIKVNLTAKVTRITPKVDDSAAEEAKAQQKAEQEAKQKRLALAKAVNSALTSIRKNATSATEIGPQGDSAEAAANYGSIVKTVYTQAWILPDSASSDDSDVKVSVTIARSGQVMDAHIVAPSGDASMDRSVQRTLERVTQIKPFSPDSTDTERTYTFSFNLKAKRQML